MHTIFLEDFDARVQEMAGRGIEPDRRETYDNGVRKATYRDPDGNEIGFGGAPLTAPTGRARLAFTGPPGNVRLRRVSGLERASDAHHPAGPGPRTPGVSAKGRRLRRRRRRPRRRGSGPACGRRASPPRRRSPLPPARARGPTTGPAPPAQRSAAGRRPR